jgi:uncharacterized Zn finger protein
MQATLYLRGSENDAYEVSFLHQEDSIYVACTCKAGAFSQLCRHKLAVLRGDPEALVDPEQREMLRQVETCLAQSTIPDLSRELHGLHERLDLLNQEAKTVKTAIELKIKHVRPNAKIWKNL